MNLHERKGGWKALRTLETIILDFRENIFNSDIVRHCETRLMLEINKILGTLTFESIDLKHGGGERDNA